MSATVSPPREFTSEKAAKVLAPLTVLNNVQLGDTELIDNIRKLLTNSEYVYNTPSHADAVLQAMKHLKSLVKERRASISLACTPDGNTPLHIACSTVTPLLRGMAPHHLADRTAFGRYFRLRNDIVLILLEAGANPFVCNYAGRNCVEEAPEGAYRESLLMLLLQYRSTTEGSVLSVPPCGASRLMKRTKGDNGFAVFSSLCLHCVYYLYKGAIYLWDVETDVEHMVYQPRDADPMIQSLERRLSGFEMRKSRMTRGSAVGEGKWTSGASFRGELTSGSSSPIHFFNPEEGEQLVKRIHDLETKVPLVSNFLVTTGVDVKPGEKVPDTGAWEWVVCNTGVAIGVRLNAKGVMMRQGQNSNAMRRRQSQVCGSVATYPEGMVLDTREYHHCLIRFTRRADSSNVCCAFDGLRRNLAYVVATKRPSQSVSNFLTPTGNDSFRAFTPTNGDTPFVEDTSNGFSRPVTPPLTHFAADASITEGLTMASSLTAPPNRGKRVSFATNHDDSIMGSSHLERSGRDGESGGHSARSSPPPHPIEKLYVTAEQGTVFRVAHLRQTGHPKEHLESVFEALCSHDVDPFGPSGIFDYTDYPVPGEYGEAICVSQCGDDVFALFCMNGVIVADATVAVGKPAVTFTDVTALINPQGLIVKGCSLPPQRFRRIKPSVQPRLLVVQSEVVELHEIRIDRNTHTLHLHPLLRLPQDKTIPHRFTPFFHTVRGELLIAYQSLKKTELCSYDFTTRTLQSLCKLPKPSSLRFFPPKKPEEIAAAKRKGTYEEEQPEIPQSIFTLSIHENSPYLLRYNVTMHVMSVYSWEEIIQKCEEKKVKMITSVFVREPKDVMLATSLQSMVKKQQQEEAKREERELMSYPCYWVIAECSKLQKIIKEHRLLARDRPDWDSRRGKVDSPHRSSISRSPHRQQRRDHSPVRILTDPNSPEGVTDSISDTITSVFRKVAIGESGKVIPYHPPPYVYLPSEDEQHTTDEIAVLEREYNGQRPRHEGVWVAYFGDASNALSCALRLQRAMIDASWSEQVLALPSCAAIAREYQPKTELQRRHKELIDNDAAAYLQRGPQVRVLVCPGTTASAPRDLLKAHRMSTDVTPCVVRGTSEPIALPVALNGVVITPTSAMKELTPLLSLMSIAPPATAKLPAPVFTQRNAVEGGDGPDNHQQQQQQPQALSPRSVYVQIVQDLTALVPQELSDRLKSSSQ